MRRTHAVVAGCTLIGGSILLHTFVATPGAPSGGQEEYEARASRGRSNRVAARHTPALDPAALAARGLRIDEPSAFGERSSFVWSTRARDPNAPTAAFAREAVIDAARAHLASVADLYGLDGADVDAAPVRRMHADPTGARRVSFGARVRGVDVFRREIHVMMDRSHALVAVSGTLPSSLELHAARGRTHAMPAETAVERALGSFAGANATAIGGSGDYERFSVTSDDGVLGDARAKRVYVDSARGLVPGFYVEVDGGREGVVARVIDAVDGTTLFENALSAAAEFSYRAFADTYPAHYTPWDGPMGTDETPHATGVPDGYREWFRAPSLVTLESLFFSRNDPWLPDGSTTTLGNNVDAYADLVPGNGYGVGDVRPTVTAPGVFDRTMLFDISPEANAEQIAASTTHLFFTTNQLHDRFYDYGFDEEAGNAQADNFGRGGLGGDRLLAESQDHEHRNDARIVVPADGASPRMEIGIYDGAGSDVDLDGSVDSTLVAHEWAHLMIRRLIGDANGLTNGQGHAIDEGTADLVALLLAVRPEDINRPSNANWHGVFAVGGYAARGRSVDSALFGMRRFGYSSNLAKNALRFRHVARGVPLPTTTPVAAGVALDGSDNHDPHHAGEVWGAMLFECYTDLLRAHPFQEAQNRMMTYLVGGLAMTPVDPTFVEARDAIVAAAFANDPADGTRLENAFARRGLGAGAVAPPRGSFDLIGGVEDDVRPEHQRRTVTYRLDDATASCDADGILDVGETGRLYVTIRNDSAYPVGSDSLAVYGASPGVVFGFPEGSSVAVPSLQPRQSATVVLAIRLDSAPSAGAVTGLGFSLGAPTVDRTPPTRVNYDRSPSGTESFSFGDASWTSFPAQGPSAPITTIALPSGDQRQLLPAPSATSDVSFTSPSISVGTGPFTLAFDLRHAFDDRGSPPVFADGLVLEVSVDGAAFVDVQEAYGIDPGYGGTLATGTSNPLAGRRAFVGLSDGFDAGPVTVTVPFGTRFAGRSVRFRFRVGTDASVGSFGAEIDDVVVTGALHDPFFASADEPSNGTSCNAVPVAVAGTPEPIVSEMVGDPQAMVRRVVLLDGSASRDPDGSPLTYSWTQLGGPTVQLANANAVTASFVADVREDTGYSFRLEVSDGVQSASAVVAVRVLDQSPKPVAAIAGITSVDERSGSVTLDGGGSSTPLGTALTYTWSQTAGPSVSFAPGQALTFTPPEVGSDTTLTFALVVHDGEKASDPVAHSVTVREVDRAPTVSVPARVDVGSNAVATITATGADEDGTPIVYTWSRIAGPAVELLGNGTATVAFVAPGVNAATTITLQVVATSGEGSSAAAEVDVVVAALVVPDAPPVLAALTTTTVDEGATASITAAATDPDGDPIGYVWTQTSGPTVTLSNDQTATVSFVAPAVDAPTVVELQVVATSLAASDAARATIVVVPVADPNAGDRAPVLDAIPAITVVAGESAGVTASATDADGDAITYAWTQIRGPGVALDDADGPEATFVAPEVDETSVVELLVTATANGATDTTVATVVVTPVSRGGGGGCSAAGRGASSPWLLALGLALLARRRALSRRTVRAPS